MGVLEGAAAGASTGIVAGPIGAVGGGLVGGLIGGFSGDDEEQMAPEPTATGAGGISAIDLRQFGGLGANAYGPSSLGYFQVNPLNLPNNWYGGYEGGAASMAGHGLAGMVDSQGRSRGAFDMMFQGPVAADEAQYANPAQSQASMADAYFGDPTFAQENGDLANRELGAREYDQMGALQLMREGAMGMAPSEAQYQMQRGLDQGLAAQQAMAGGARGQAGLALAGGNAMANAASMQNQAYTQAAALRAKEMQDYTNAYGSLASQVRAQDQSRLAQGNQMSMQNAQYGNEMAQFNARQAQDASTQNAQMNTNAGIQNAAMSTNAGIQNASQGNQMNLQNAQMVNQYRMGAGNVGAAYGNIGLGYLNQANAPYQTELGSQNQQRGQDVDNYYKAAGLTASSHDTAAGIFAGLRGADLKAKMDERNANLALLGTGVSTLGAVAGAAMKS